jgi:DinB family protein
MSHLAGRPERSEFSSHYAPFVARVPDGDIVELLALTGERRDACVAGISEVAAAVPPPAGKWSIRETLGHLGDMERVLAYRALHIARGNRAPIPGVEQDEYVSNSYAAQRTVDDLRTELRALRTSTVCLFASLPSGTWLWQGVIEGDAVSVRALAYIIVGHDLHHLQQLAGGLASSHGSHRAARSA